MENNYKFMKLLLWVYTCFRRAFIKKSYALVKFKCKNSYTDFINFILLILFNYA